MKTIQQIFNENVADFKEDVIKMIKATFEKDKQVFPVVFALIMKDEKLGIAIIGGLGELFVSSIGKEQASKIIKEITKEIKPVALAFSSEAWSLSEKIGELSSVIDEKGNYKEGMSPDQHPDKVESLFISFETFDKECAIHWEIVREGNKEPYLKESLNTNWQDKQKEFKSKFQDLIQDNYSEVAEIIKKQLELSVN